MATYKLNINKNVGMKVVLLLFALVMAFQLSIMSVFGIKPIAFLIVSVSLITIFSYIFWKEAVIGFIIWVLFVGAFRKWIFYEVSDVVFFFGHAIVTGVYIRYFLIRLQERSPLFIKHPVNPLILLLVIWGIICMLNPRLPNIMVGILGFVVYFYFIPLAYIIPHVFSSKEILIKLLKAFTFLSIPLLILGVVQFYSPPDHPINVFVVTDPNILALAGGYVRVSSTFSYLSGFSMYLNILILILVYLISLRGHSLLYTIFLYVTLILSLVGIMTTGSRGPATYAFGGVLLYLIFAGTFNSAYFMRFLSRAILIALIAFLFFKFIPTGNTVLSAFMERAAGQSDIIPRLKQTYEEPFNFFPLAGLYGYGIGITYQGSTAVGHNPYKLMTVTGGFEQEQGRIMIEMGLAGYLLVYLLRILLVFFGFKLFKTLRDQELRLLSFALTCFILPPALGIPNFIFDHTSNIFYWYVVGILFLLPKLDESSKKPQESKI